MAEYASFWSDMKASEFARQDLDHDGVITPRECLAAQEMAELAATDSAEDAGGWMDSSDSGPTSAATSPSGADSEGSASATAGDAGAAKAWWMN
jgi:hypothetical protein